MIPMPFETLLSRVLPYLRTSGDGSVGRPSTIEPRIRLLVVPFWLGHGGSQFNTCEVPDMAESKFSPVLREVLRAILSALPPHLLPDSLSEQASVAEGLITRVGCRIRHVLGAINGCFHRHTACQVQRRIQLSQVLLRHQSPSNRGLVEAASLDPGGAARVHSRQSWVPGK